MLFKWKNVKLRNTFEMIDILHVFDDKSTSLFNLSSMGFVTFDPLV